MLNTALIALLSLVTAAASGARSPYEIARFSQHSADIYSVNVTPAGHVITSAGDDSVYSWNLGTCEVETEQEFDWAHRIRSAVAPDGNVVVSVDGSPGVLIWARHNPKACVIRTDAQDFVQCVAFAPDRRYLATGDEDGSVILWDASKIYQGTSLTTSSDDKRRTLKADGEVESLEFSPDSTLLATISANDKLFIFELWRVATGERLQRLEVEGLALAFAPDGTHFVAGKTVYHTTTFRPIARLDSFHPLHAAAFDPEGSCLVTAGEDNRLVFWDPRTGRKQAVVRAHDDAVTCLAFTADGGKVVTGSNDSTARIWDARRILADRPMDEPMSKLAASSHAFDVWRLGFCYSRGILMMDAKRPNNYAIAEAAERARTLGVELPALPTEEQLKVRGIFLGEQMEHLAGQLAKRLDKTHASLFQAGGGLPTLRSVYDPQNESMQKFGSDVLSKIGVEMETEFGALPTMFETFNDRVVGKVLKRKMEKAFDALIREITLTLQAQQQALVAGQQSQSGDRVESGVNVRE